MTSPHTHYDNLKVARNAPPEVIRAAYKTLSQKFHPDRNLGNQSATQTFQIISAAYEVLSDPVRRREHDKWIAAIERTKPPAAAATATPARARHPASAQEGSQSWQQRTSFASYPLSRSSRLDALRGALRTGLSKRQTVISYLFVSFAATLVLFAVVVS